MTKVYLNGTPLYGDDSYNEYDDVEEITIKPTKYGQYTIWFGKNDEMYIQAGLDIQISIVSQYSNTIKINT